MLTQWKREFLSQLKMGVPPEKACRSAAGRSLREVQDERENDPFFADAWDAITDPDAGRGKALSRVLVGETLEALLWAQCTDEQAAAYFNLELPEFLEKIEADPELKRIHKLARLGGQAQLRMAQMNEASAGNTAVQIHLAKHVLGQHDKIDQTVRHEVPDIDSREMAKQLLFVLREGGLTLDQVIDADYTEVEVGDGLQDERSRAKEIASYSRSEGKETEE